MFLIVLEKYKESFQVLTIFYSGVTTQHSDFLFKTCLYVKFIPNSIYKHHHVLFRNKIIYLPI